MEDTELREQFHAIVVRMERFEGRLDSMEKTVADFRTEARGRLEAVDRRGESLENRLTAKLEGLENRMKDKADWRVVAFSTTLLLVAMTVYKFVV
jgi:hypothetical protein